MMYIETGTMSLWDCCVCMLGDHVLCWACTIWVHKECIHFAVYGMTLLLLDEEYLCGHNSNSWDQFLFSLLWLKRFPCRILLSFFQLLLFVEPSSQDSPVSVISVCDWLCSCLPTIYWKPIHINSISGD